MVDKKKLIHFDQIDRAIDQKSIHNRTQTPSDDDDDDLLIKQTSHRTHTHTHTHRSISFYRMKIDSQWFE